MTVIIESFIEVLLASIGFTIWFVVLPVAAWYGIQYYDKKKRAKHNPRHSGRRRAHY